MEKIGIAVQTIGLVTVGVGIGFEIGIGGDIFTYLIAIGSAIFAVGTKIRGK